MSIRARIENHLSFVCKEVDLTTLSNLELYIKQPGLYLEYIPEVVSAHEMLVVLPLKDAMRLNPKQQVKIQFAFVDANGVPDACDEATYEVKNLLKEAGYDPLRN